MDWLAKLTFDEDQWLKEQALRVAQVPDGTIHSIAMTIPTNT